VCDELQTSRAGNTPSAGVARRLQARVAPLDATVERGVPVRIGPVARERESTIERTERWHGARDRGGD
jgi:hypothetical protein